MRVLFAWKIESCWAIGCGVFLSLLQVSFSFFYVARMRVKSMPFGLTKQISNFGRVVPWVCRGLAPFAEKKMFFFCCFLGSLAGLLVLFMSLHGSGRAKPWALCFLALVSLVCTWSLHDIWVMRRELAVSFDDLCMIVFLSMRFESWAFCMGMNMIACSGMIMNLGRELHGEHDIALVESLPYQSKGWVVFYFCLD